jgi:hypothetical protein
MREPSPSSQRGRHLAGDAARGRVLRRVVGASPAITPARRLREARNHSSRTVDRDRAGAAGGDPAGAGRREKRASGVTGAGVFDRDAMTI